MAVLDKHINVHSKTKNECHSNRANVKIDPGIMPQILQFYHRLSSPQVSDFIPPSFPRSLYRKKQPR